MMKKQALSILAVLATSTLVSAHGHVAAWTVNGERKAGYDGTYPPQYGPTAERPTDTPDNGWTPYKSPSIACGGASTGNVQTWDLDAGSTVTAHWNTWPDQHKGPVTEYMARCPGTSCDGVPADSLDWFKISEANYKDGRWPTQDVAATNDWSFKIPSELAPGAWLVRHDLLALHEPLNPQFYPVCFQANLKSAGTLIPRDNTVRFPAALEAFNTGFKDINLYYGFDLNAFVPPGPPIYDFAAGGGAGSAPSVASAPAPAPAPSAAPEPAPAPAPSPSPSPAAPGAPELPSPVPEVSSSAAALPPTSSISATSSTSTSSTAPITSTSVAVAAEISVIVAVPAVTPVTPSVAAKPPKTCNKKRKRGHVGKRSKAAH